MAIVIEAAKTLLQLNNSNAERQTAMWLMGRIKEIVNRLLKPVGHRIDYDAVIPRFEKFAAFLKKRADVPKTVFDIGVATGTPWLYASFPDSKYYLVDPTPQSLPYMQSWAKKLNAEVWNFALGNYDGKVSFNLRCDQAGSTMFEEFGRKADVLEKTIVPMHRFDTVVGEINRPALMKIDIQGAEILMLEGMGDRIREMDYIIVETALIATLEGSPEFAQVVALMKSSGFVLFDLTGIIRRPLDQAVAQIDAVFVPEESQLRSDRRWAP